MGEITVDPTIKTDMDGRPMLRLIVRGHEVEARFSEEANEMIGPRLKQVLMDAYLRTLATETIAC